MADDEEYEEVVEYYTEEVVYEEVPGEGHKDGQRDYLTEVHSPTCAQKLWRMPKSLQNELLIFP
ncbi:hypothetical protein P7K49_014106 [Saguinus oedipus]|uniref:Uncharacterized protein n=1 Tax=Saguinus oedipus TaxID=9490 RepID=A0ABQ9VHV0_SAGOE|nr:hypothetical protein P7K49_014106 [Saguinus oedipus]